MKTDTNQHTCRMIEEPERHAAMLTPLRPRNGNGRKVDGRNIFEKTKLWPRRFTLGRFTLYALTLLAIACPASSATITGNLTDLSLAPLNTTLQFNPTNIVLVNSAGLSAGPPKTVDSTNGAFSLVLDAGDYTVCLPLIPWRNCFSISVPAGTNTYNLTNLL